MLCLCYLAPPRWRVMGLGVLLLGLSGCSARLQPAPMHAPLLPAAAPVRNPGLVTASVVQVQSSPLYHQAEQAYQRHQFQKAFRLLDQLAASPGLSPDALAFCQRQRVLCLQAQGKKITAPSSVIQTASLPPPAASPAEADCGPRALALVCQRLGVSASVAQLRKLAGTTAKGTSMAGLAKAAKSLGLKAEGVQVSREALGKIELPALVWLDGNHYDALWSVQGEGEQATVSIRDPNKVHEETIDKERLLQRSRGYLLLVHR